MQWSITGLENLAFGDEPLRGRFLYLLQNGEECKTNTVQAFSRNGSNRTVTSQVNCKLIDWPNKPFPTILN